MKRNKRATRNRLLPENDGFSLIELIIGIVVLVIVMLPMFNSFYQSARVNNKAKELQFTSTLASSIMEGIKSMSIGEIRQQFEGPVDEFRIIKPINGQTIDGVRLKKHDEENNTYEFAIDGIKNDNNAYDALIIMRAGTFKTKDGILNSYPMPEAINLDIFANGIIFSDGRPVYPDHEVVVLDADEDALSKFLEEGERYARKVFEQSDFYQNTLTKWQTECEEAIAAGEEPPPRPAELNFNKDKYPAYCDEATVKSEISKSMNITINQADEYYVSFNIAFRCNWPDAGSLASSLEYNIMNIKYPNPTSNVYLFYMPSGFGEELINLDNLTTEHAINFFLAKQGDLDVPDITINMDRTDNIKVYTNISNPLKLKLMDKGFDFSSEIIRDIMESSKKDRIFDVEIKIYTHTDDEAIKHTKELELFNLKSSTDDIG